MRSVLSGVAVFALAAASMSVAAGQSSHAMSSSSMPKCTSATGPVVWYNASAKKYYTKGAAQYGKGTGSYVCRATAVARGKQSPSHSASSSKQTCHMGGMSSG
ncbi:MAG TPA: hypothetical protein VK665_06455, partial [Candidatus Elarobacter sp.]|nr:hypothetical protein [Candidatus Elarobacter sp.]